MTSRLWQAPVASGTLDATVEIPGSKSLSARELYLAATADSPSSLTGLLDSRDTRLFMDALRLLGADIEFSGTSAHVVPLDPQAPERTDEISIDCGLSGTVMRFIPPLAALSSRITHFDGDEGARLRPLKPLLDALAQCGATITYHGEKGFLPFTIQGPLQLPAGAAITVDACASSQFVSSLLLVAPMLSHPVTISAPGKVVSLPHIEMTCQTMRAHGCDVEEIDEGTPALHSWHVINERSRGLVNSIEPDLSNAGPFLAAALVCGGKVTIPHWPAETTQAGDAWRDILPWLGADVTLHDGALTVSAKAGHIRGIDVELADIGELTPTIAALTVFADSPSLLRGIGHLRGHETDRLAALATELRACGCQVDEGTDYLAITPPTTPTPALHHAYADHRMATFAAILGLGIPGTTLDDIACTAKTLPDFPSMWASLVASSKEASIEA
ncbi:3-phosphoshikimate 1-carboxyvinyltransferase [Pauljensenia sp. OF14-1SRA]|uniref:3-phosphoshikimate 1-carboxyvinyltransferase n=1 Tax=Pauljensenia sp. OF14-1SRA TaxID=2998062 RepID=UPI0022E908DB|nr:3-phosphoshikimate 1-carboxyvinyltransferase [Pauljensenia sp. OF14-1SRA]